MRMSRYICLLLCVVALNACASRPNGKLASEYAGQTFDVGLATYSERELQVKIDRRNAYAGGGGLIGALAVGVISGIEKANASMTASDRLDVIKQGFDFDYVKDIERQYTKVIGEADWLKLVSVVHADRNDSRNQDVIFKKAASADVNVVGVVQYGYVFNEAFNSLTSSATMQLRPYENGSLKQQVYHLHVYDTYYLKGAALTEPGENLNMWLEHDSEQIRDALKKTSAKVEERLREHLKDPYLMPKG